MVKPFRNSLKQKKFRGVVIKNCIAVRPSKLHINAFCVNGAKSNVLRLFSLQVKY